MNTPAEIFNNCALEYQERFMDTQLYHTSFDYFCKLIESAEPRVLEVGCGPGNISQYLLSKNETINLFGIDLAPEMVKLAAENNPTAEFRVMDVKNIATLPGNFNAVMSGFCLPYLSKEESLKFIEDCASLIIPGGVLFISTMEGSYSKSRIITPSSGDKTKGLFTYYHEVSYLEKGLIDSGFEIVSLSRQEFPGVKTDDWNDLILIAKRVAI